MKLDPQLSTLIGGTILLLGGIFLAKKFLRVLLILAAVGAVGYWWFYLR